MMRPALACLTATLMATISASAFAQTTSDTMAPPPPAPPMTAPAMTAPPTTAPTAQPDAAVQPMPGMSAPATPQDAAPAAPPAAPEPAPAPPTQESNYAIQLLNEVCLPLIHHADVKAIAKAHGFRSSHDTWTLKLDAGKSIALSPPSRANPTVCSLNIAFEVDQWRPIVEALNNWAYGHNPPLALLYQGYKPASGLTTTWSWQVNAPEGNLGLAFNVSKKSNGSPAGGKYDIGALLVTDTRPSGT